METGRVKSAHLPDVKPAIVACIITTMLENVVFIVEMTSVIYAANNLLHYRNIIFMNKKQARKFAKAIQEILWWNGYLTEHDADTLAEVANLSIKFGFGPEETLVYRNSSRTL